MTGATGATGATGPSVNAVFLQTPEAVSNGSWIGMGGTNSDFGDSAVVIPQNAVLTRIALNIGTNSLTAGQSVTATVFRKGCTESAVSTGLSAVITGPNPNNCSILQSGSAALTALDRVAVRFSTVPSNLRLPDGVSVTLQYTV